MEELSKVAKSYKVRRYLARRLVRVWGLYTGSATRPLQKHYHLRKSVAHAAVASDPRASWFFAVQPDRATPTAGTYARHGSPELMPHLRNLGCSAAWITSEEGRCRHSARIAFTERRRRCATWRAGEMRAETERLCSPGCPPEPGVQGLHLPDGARGTRNGAPRSQFAARGCVSGAREKREWSAVLTDLCTASMICLNMYSIGGPPAACAAGWEDAETDIGKSLCEMRGYGGDGRKNRDGVDRGRGCIA